MILKRTIAAAAALPPLAFGLAACGISSPGHSANSKTVVIGAPYPLSGTWAQNGTNSLNGMKLAAQQINAAGGIKGFGGAKIQIVSADTSSDNPGQAKSVTTQLINSDHAVAIVGSYLSSLSLTTVVSAQRAKVPMITQSFVTQLTDSGYTYLFQICPQAPAFGQATVQDLTQAEKQQGRTVSSLVSIYGNDASDVQQGQSVDAAAKAAGLNLAGDIQFPDGLSTAAAIVSKVAAAHPDAISIAAALPDEELIIRGIRSQGVTAPIVSAGGGGALTTQFASTLGPDANGVLATSSWNWDLKLPGVAQANALYKQKYHANMPQETGESWAAVYEIAAAVAKAKSDDPTQIRNALASMTFTQGPASAMSPGVVSYNSHGKNTHVAPILAQWQNGVLRTVYPASVAVAKIQQLSS